MPDDAYLSVRDLAARWSCRPAHVLGLIRAGRLPAIDISAGRRPTYRISAEAVAAYEARHQVAPPAPRVPRPRRLAPAKFYP